MSPKSRDFFSLPEPSIEAIPQVAHSLRTKWPTPETLIPLIKKSAEDFYNLPNIAFIHVEDDAVRVYDEKQPDRPYELNTTEASEVPCPCHTRLHVVGDVHGQYIDVLGFFDKLGLPSPSNTYLFNGDIVDRGPQSVEIFTLLLYIRQCYTKETPAVIFNRGNHESYYTSSIYGFLGELKRKYARFEKYEEVYSNFLDMFLRIPLCAVIANSIFVVHGGLPASTTATLDDIDAVYRFCEPGEDMMGQLLWSDPCAKDGYNASPRPFCRSFGPDVTHAWLKTNNLRMVLRSHQVVDGFVRMHSDRLATVFSAPGSVCGNAAGIVTVTKTCTLSVSQFQEAKHRKCTVM